MIGRFLKPECRAQHEWHGFLTTRDHLNDLWASRMSMSRWSNTTESQRSSEATRLSISPAPTDSSEVSKKAETAFSQLAHFSQPQTKAQPPTGPPIETRQEIQMCRSIFRNETKK